MKDYYGILEVNEKASQEIIEKAYKTLVKKYHPDLYSSVQKKDAEIKLKDINEAYHILSDSFLRSQYDLELQKERNRVQTASNETVENMQNRQQYQQNMTQQRNRNILNKESKKDQTEYVQNKNNVGTIFGIMDLVKALWMNKPQRGEKRKMDQKDWLAVGLTIIAVIVIGVILWFIPFTNGWMRQLLFENPIFDLISGLFS